MGNSFYSRDSRYDSRTGTLLLMNISSKKPVYTLKQEGAGFDQSRMPFLNKSTGLKYSIIKKKIYIKLYYTGWPFSRRGELIYSFPSYEPMLRMFFDPSKFFDTIPFNRSYRSTDKTFYLMNQTQIYLLSRSCLPSLKLLTD